MKALRLLPLLGVALLCSCYDDEAGGCPDGGAPVTVQFKITAENAGDLNGTRADEPAYEAGADHEYISNLCVLIVKDGVLKEKLLLQTSDFDVCAGSDTAQAGNIKSCTSRALTLAPGTYVIYAFANLNTAYSTEWSSLTGLTVGCAIPGCVDIDNMVLCDPAGKICFSSCQFIPMSAKETVTVNSSTSLISIGLDRLVSKVRMRVSGPAGKTITSLTFKGAADKVALFEDHTFTCSDDCTFDKEYTPETDCGTFKCDENSKQSEVIYKDFYVNATPERSDGFTVTLTTNEDGGTTYISTTARKALPRNSIYPLDLTLNPYGLCLTGWYSVAAIGSLPVYFNADFEHKDTYSVTIAEGSKFAFKICGVTLDGSGCTAATSYNWAIDPAAPGFEFTSCLNQQTVEGHVTASAGKTFPFTAEVHWTAYSHAYTRIYTVNVTTSSLADINWNAASTDEPTLTRSAVWGDIPAPEVLNVFRKKN